MAPPSQDLAARGNARSYRLARATARCFTGSFLACILAAAAEAQEAAPAQTPSRPRPAPPQTAAPAVKAAESPEACGRSPAIYWAGSGPRVTVARQGALASRKPLEPDSAAVAMVVLEVRINEKAATAYGPGFDELRRGGPPGQLEQESGAAIRWSDGLAGLPATLTVVAEEGPEVIARLRFERCAARAERPRERPRPAPRQAPTPDPAPKRDTPPTALPRGAIQ
jgi:hypothetical protein